MMRIVACLASSFVLSAVVTESKTVEYTWTLRPSRASPAVPNAATRAELNNPALSPDCNLDRLMLLVNDVFPGPPIRADVGDVVMLTLITRVQPIHSRFIFTAWTCLDNLLKTEQRR